MPPFGCSASTTRTPARQVTWRTVRFCPFRGWIGFTTVTVVPRGAEPGANQILYAGVLAGNAAWRAEVVPNVPTSTEAEREARAALKLVKAEDRRARGERAEQRRCWAELLRRVFEYDALVSHYLL